MKNVVFNMAGLQFLTIASVYGLSGHVIRFNAYTTALNDGTAVLYFNCSSTKPAQLPFVEFLVNGKSTASFIYISESGECVFKHSEANCTEYVCRCSSDGQTFQWTFPPIFSKMKTVKYSCHMYINSKTSFDQAQIYNNETNMKSLPERYSTAEPLHYLTTTNKVSSFDKVSDLKSLPERYTRYITDKVLLLPTTMNKVSSFDKVSDMESLPARYGTKKPFLMITKMKEVSSFDTASDMESLPARYSTKKPFLLITKMNEVSSFDTASALQHWFYYGPLIGVGLFCLFLFGCNIIVSYKCRASTVVIQQTIGRVPQQTQLASVRPIETSQGEQNHQLLDYESIDERGMVGIGVNNEIEDLDISQNSVHSYLDVIHYSSEPAPYELVSFVPDEVTHEYRVLEKTNNHKTYNDNKIEQESTNNSPVISTYSKSGSSTDYMDIFSRNSSCCENTPDTHFVLSVSNLSSDLI